MRTPTVTLWLAASLAAAQISLAQQPPDIPPAQAPSAETAVSDADLETFAAIYVDLVDIAARFEAEMKAAQTEQQALELRERTQAESIAKVTQRGWTPEQFDRVGDAINNDPVLIDKAKKLITER
jgi:hypothetical protein